jgi:hypothetical protein
MVFITIVPGANLNQLISWGPHIVSRAMEKLHQRSQEHLLFWQPVIAEVVKAILAECQESKRPIIFAAEQNRSSWVLLGPAGWPKVVPQMCVCVYIYINIHSGKLT